MQTVERILALRKLQTFRHTSDRELILLAEVMHCRHFPPHQLILEAGKVGVELHVVISGEVEVNGFSSAEELLGLESILLGVPHRSTWKAGSDGARCLILDRAYVFTLIHECPSVLLTSLGEDFGASR